MIGEGASAGKGRKGGAPPGATPWTRERWLRTFESEVDPFVFAEGVELARLGRARDMTVTRGEVGAVVADKPRGTRQASLKVQTLPHADWERATRALASQAVFAAKILAGELPPTIEDALAPAQVHLFPREGEVTPACSCARHGGWCRHSVAVAAAFADRLSREPFAVFELRGITPEDLLDRLRERRALEGDPGLQAGAAAMRRTMGGAGLSAGPPLDNVLDAFWDAGPGLDDIDTTPRAPEVRHALLRRLGPSPFGQGAGAFPMVGLLATCYDVISETETAPRAIG